MAQLVASIRSVFSKEAFNMETNPLDVVRALGPSLVPFFKTVAIFFVTASNISNRPLFAVVKCLPIISLIIFVVMHYRTRLAPKKGGDSHKLQLLRVGVDSTDLNVHVNGGNKEAPNGKLPMTSENGSPASRTHNVHELTKFVWEKPALTPLLRGEQTRYARLVLIGLIASLGGDICLVWSAQLFLCGMLLFAVAHIAYAAAFSFMPRNPLGFLFVLAVGLVYHWFMQINFHGVYMVAAPCYSILIGTMWWRSLSRLKLGAEFWKWTSIASCFGATLFAMSDSLLGIAVFAGGFPYVNTLVMLTYYAAQFGIAVSVVDTYRDREVTSNSTPSSPSVSRTAAADCKKCD